MIELQNFIKNNMPTARFVGNPYYSQINDIYYIYLTYEIEDINKLYILFDKWKELDNLVETKKVKVSLINQIINYFKK